MAQFAQSDLLPAQQLEVLRNEIRRVDFRYEILDNTGASKGFFADIQHGMKITYGYFNDVKRTCAFTVAENQADLITRINFLSDRVKPWIDFTFVGPTGLTTLSYPGGVFVMANSKRSKSGNLVTYDVTGSDLSKLLSMNLTTVRFEATVNMVVTDLVAGLLSDLSIVNAIVPSFDVMNITKTWDIGTSRLTIVNDLLKMIGYESLWFDGNGTAQSSLYQSPSDRAVTITYNTTDQSVLSQDIDDELDLSQVPNQWTLVYSDPEAPSVAVTVQNNSATSPTSIINRGYIVSYFNSDNQDAVTESALRAKAARKASEDSQVYENINFSTPLMPIHSETEIVSLTHSSFIATSNFQETTWEMTLDENTPMSHGVRGIVSIGQV